MMPRSLFPHPDYAERISKARKRLGLEQSDVASRLDQPPGFLLDLEGDPNEVLMALSLGDLASLCRVLDIRPRVLLSDTSTPPLHVLPVPDLVARIRAYMASHQLGLEGFEERAGWAVGAALEDPERVRDWNPDGLWDICQLIGEDWLAALPE